MPWRWCIIFEFKKLENQGPQCLSVFFKDKITWRSCITDTNNNKNISVSQKSKRIIWFSLSISVCVNDLSSSEQNKTEEKTISRERRTEYTSSWMMIYLGVIVSKHHHQRLIFGLNIPGLSGVCPVIRLGTGISEARRYILICTY